MRASARLWALPARVVLACLVVGLLAGTLAGTAYGEAEWSTYHRDTERSGADPDAGTSAAPAFAWQSVDLGAPIWSQPLVLAGRVYVATVGDEIYALEAASGDVIWKQSVGTPVPASALPCGDIQPTVGVVGTPVIDPANGTLYAVADTWDASHEEAHHILVGLSLSDGKETLSVPVDPPGTDPKALLQRTALNLDHGRVIFGYGGNDGDCSDYRGTVVSAPQSGGTALFWQDPIALPSTSGGAVWATSGPAVDGSGYVYATTGNPDPPSGQRASTFDYSDSVVKLDPAQNFVANPALESAAPLGFFEPPNWEEESNNDLDLSSAGAELLPGGLLFQAGKDGVGYLIDTATMNSGAPALYSGEVCGGAGSFGGDAYANGTLYIPCTDGVQALAYNQTAPSFAALWQGPTDAFGPPIVSGGLVWSVATGGFHGGGDKLYGLDPATGVARYTETLPSPVADHFASPSAAGGQLFLATGSTVSAYRLTQLPPGSTATSGSGTKGSLTTPGSSHQRPLTATRLLHRRLHATASGRVRLALSCPKATSSCRGTLTLRTEIDVLVGQGMHRHRRLVAISLAHGHFGPQKGTFALTLHLDRAAQALLKAHHRHLALTVVIESPASSARRVSAALT